MLKLKIHKLILLKLMVLKLEEFKLKLFELKEQLIMIHMNESLTCLTTI